jgi:sugar/nucleoside kinase (ribokinase family)
MLSGDISVIGTVSSDTLHLADGQTAHTFGGAGLYTALAASKSRGNCTLFAPKPDPLPDGLARVTRNIVWEGPRITSEQLPRLEIRHHGQGKATLLNAAWGAEPSLLPAQIPDTVKAARFVHIAALSSANRQLAFLEQLTTSRPKISVGTYGRLVYGNPDIVRQIFRQADLFFMNQNEAIGLFGDVKQCRTRDGAILFVTLDAAGALVIEGAEQIMVPGTPAKEIDPTGAGDTFCGATLAGLSAGLSPVEAARQAVKLAAQTVAGVGPTALLA